ncbi:MAG TPA: glycoside hydrolase family 88 protein [Verrucomicrobiae bacterium]|nr:glycoside hydrolase family 88 protein [Verrucomicrobiae bacterium]
MKRKCFAAWVLVLMTVAGGCVTNSSRDAARNYLHAFPPGASPQEVGTRVARRFIASPHPNFGNPNPPGEITYPESVAWWGALTFADLSGDTALRQQLVSRFEPLFNQERKLVPRPGHVDATVFGAVPLEIYLQTGDGRCRELGQRFADAQWQAPESARNRMNAELRSWVDQGYSWQTRLWIDDMFMITMIQAQAFRATKDPVYIDRAAREMVLYLEKLQQTNGLFYHAPDVPFFWGRGNGWMAAGMTELLRALPESHPHRRAILAGYRRMMESLLRYQSGTGMWRQLVDHPESWPESSCTGMFTFAMITGVKCGWLEAEIYGPAARKGWLALIGYIDANGDVRDVCEGTNKKNSLKYYLNRKRLVGDMHGQAPVLWCASALLR